MKSKAADRSPFCCVREDRAIFSRYSAFAVHVFTAIGSVLGFLALVEASAHRWQMAFAWLGVALVVDGVDGPIARHIGVTKKLPRFSGDQLDLIIDYLTYVVVPAYIIYEAGIVPAGLELAAAAIVLLTSLFHFIDQESKTKDGFFVGFPAIWNIVALYLLIFPFDKWLAFAVLAVLGSLTFVPLKWIHPIRVRRLRPLTLLVMIAWAAAAVAALRGELPSSLTVQAVIAVSTIYFIAVGLLRSWGGDDPSATD
jgi:phosphatidylcholine synthase